MEEQKIIEENPDEIMNKLTKDIFFRQLNTKDNDFYEEIQMKTLYMSVYFRGKVKKFPELFEKNLTNFRDTINYLEKISYSNNCECSENTDDIPGWKCKDCSDNENSLYCSKCFLKFKDYHKDHKVFFVPYNGGMCDCGNINNINKFCPDHKGPYTDQKQIDDFIEKSFETKILEKLKTYFDDLFLEFSKFFVLTEQCTFFCTEIISINIKDEKEREDITILNENFCIVFQNLLSFLNTITYKNLGMLYLVSKYILKNHFSLEFLEEKYKTGHSCIKIDKKNIEILYEAKDNNDDIFSINYLYSQDKHICQCSFLRLLLSNWRSDIMNEEQNDNLLFSLTHNLFFKYTYTVLFYFIYKDILFNDNLHVISSRSKFITEESIQFLDNHSYLLENCYRIFYKYCKGLINHPISRDPNGGFHSFVIRAIFEKFEQIAFDFNFYSKPKIKKIIGKHNNIIKTFIDIACVLQNILEFKSIYPHPSFQEKAFSPGLINCELISILLGGLLSLCYDYEQYDNIKDIFDYFMKKIINQKAEGIKQLEEKEFSFHLTLYRFFAIFLNTFILKHSLKAGNSFFESINYIKTKLFNSKEEIEKVVDIIIFDYFKFFGFITGIRNELFKYYE